MNIYICIYVCAYMYMHIYIHIHIYDVHVLQKNHQISFLNSYMI